MKKSSFLLLEVLIAFSLVSLCAVPIVKGQLNLYQFQFEHLIKMEKERLADWTFSEIKEMFLKNEIPWNKIPLKKQKSELFSLKTALLDIPNCDPIQIKRSFYLFTSGEKGTKNGQITRQLNIYVLLDKQKYQFRFPVVKLAKKKS